MGKYITQRDVDTYLMLQPLLAAIYHEMQELSKKKPDSLLNAYKVKAINRILIPLKQLMKEDDVFAFLDVLDDNVLPSNSDMVLILSQYIKATTMYVDLHQSYNRDIHENEWNFEPAPKPNVPQRKKK